MMIDIANNRFCIILNAVHVTVVQTIQRGLRRSESLPSDLLKCLMLGCGTWKIYIAQYYKTYYVGLRGWKSLHCSVLSNVLCWVAGPEKFTLLNITQFL